MYTIRQAIKEDIDRMAQIEAVCFSEAEAASLESFQKRFAVFADCFFVIEVNGIVVGHINGCIYNAPELPDALYSDANLHCPTGDYQMIFGLAVDPNYQKQGYAAALTKYFVDVSRANGRKGMVLTCKDYLVDFYRKLGFDHKGVSASNHGGAQWHDMILMF